MIEALGMRLETVRTVLKNGVNEVAVCADRKRESGEYYTVISVFSFDVRRRLAGLLAEGSFFSGSSDYIGSFAHRDSLCLVFRYRPEKRLSEREPIFVQSFAERKNVCFWFLAACAESGVPEQLGTLLLRERNINLEPDGRVYFNYFFDFSEWGEGTPAFFTELARYAFGILAREYEQRYDREVERYPLELAAFHKKIESGGFSGYNPILTAVKLLPDRPTERNVGWRRIIGWLAGLWNFFRAHTLELFVALLVVVTLLYAGYQIIIRINARRISESNTSYSGVEVIGDVYLGEDY